MQCNEVSFSQFIPVYFESNCTPEKIYLTRNAYLRTIVTLSPSLSPLSSVLQGRKVRF